MDRPPHFSCGLIVAGSWVSAPCCNALKPDIRPPAAIPPQFPRPCMLLFTRRAALALPLLAATAVRAATEEAANTVVLTTKNGKVVIRLRPDWAPKHVAQIETLVKRGFYDGIVFHRVIPGFMAQTGDPTGTGSGGSDLPNMPAEFNKTHFKRGIVGMARSRTRIRPIRSSSSASATRASSTASTPPSARSSPAWTSSTRSRLERKPTTGRWRTLTRSSPCAWPGASK